MASDVTALVTGAASGIGRCFARALAENGMDLILIDVDEEGLAATGGLVESTGRRVSRAAADVADRAAVERTVNELTEPAGRLDLLINCAAILGGGSWALQSPEEFERVLRVNLLGTVNVMRSALPMLCRAGGHVVNIASTAAVHGWPGLVAYSASKFGVAGYSEAVRAELQEKGVGLTVVFPLLIDTPLIRDPGVPPILRHGRRIPAEAVVTKTLRAVARKRPRVYVPESVRFIAALQGLFPALLDWYGARMGLERK